MRHIRWINLFIFSLIFVQVKFKTLESFELKERVELFLKEFEATLHETLLTIIQDRNKTSQLYEHPVYKFVKQSSLWSKSDFEGFLDELSSFSSLSICIGEVRRLLKNDINWDDIAKPCKQACVGASKLITRFAEAERAIVFILNAYETLLPFCFDNLELRELNKQIKTHILDCLTAANFNDFEDLSVCVNNLITMAEGNRSSGFMNYANFDSFDASVQFKCLNQFVEANDKKSTHALNNWMRETFLTKLDFYCADLVEFRNVSARAFECFELELNVFLIEFVSSSVGDQRNLLEQTSHLFSKDKMNQTYINRIDMYRQVLVKLIDHSQSSLGCFFESAKSLMARLDIQHHSHYIFFDAKFTYFETLLTSFNGITYIYITFIFQSNILKS